MAFYIWAFIFTHAVDRRRSLISVHRMKRMFLFSHRHWK